MPVTPADVKQIYETQKSDTDISAFIDTASLVVSEQLGSSGLSTTRLDKITLYLTAHFLVISEEGGGIRRSRLGEGDESYVVPSGSDAFGYVMTRFGQQALALDTSGKLAASQANKGIKAGLEVI